MKRILISLASLLLFACGNSTQKAQENEQQYHTLPQSESTPETFADLPIYKKEPILRKKFEDYCQARQEDGMLTLWRAFSREYMYHTAPEHGCWEYLTITKSDDANFNVFALTAISHSANQYATSIQYGQLTSTGMKFIVDPDGEILKHEYYVAFDKNGEVEFYFTDDTTGFPLDDMLKQM